MPTLFIGTSARDREVPLPSRSRLPLRRLSLRISDRERPATRRQGDAGRAESDQTCGRPGTRCEARLSGRPHRRRGSQARLRPGTRPTATRTPRSGGRRAPRTRPGRRARRRWGDRDTGEEQQHPQEPHPIGEDRQKGAGRQQQEQEGQPPSGCLCRPGPGPEQEAARHRSGRPHGQDHTGGAGGPVASREGHRRQLDEAEGPDDQHGGGHQGHGDGQPPLATPGHMSRARYRRTAGGGVEAEGHHPDHECAPTRTRPRPRSTITSISGPASSPPCSPSALPATPVSASPTRARPHSPRAQPQISDSAIMLM